jgi:hypothetical protein
VLTLDSESAACPTAWFNQSLGIFSVDHCHVAESGVATRTRGGQMTEPTRVLLEGEQLEYARQARQAMVENMMALREIVFNALGMEMSTHGDARFAVRVSNNPDDCTDFQDENGNCVGQYCDPPGICQPCPP